MKTIYELIFNTGKTDYYTATELRELLEREYSILSLFEQFPNLETVIVHGVSFHRGQLNENRLLS